MAVFAGSHGVANGLDAVLDAAFELQVRKRPRHKNSINWTRKTKKIF